MTYTSASQTEQMTFAIEADEMAISVMLVSWLVKQQQLIKQQQDLIEKQKKELEALKEENAQLKDSREQLKNRSDQNSSVPPHKTFSKNLLTKASAKKEKSAVPNIITLVRHAMDLESLTQLNSYGHLVVPLVENQ